SPRQFYPASRLLPRSPRVERKREERGRRAGWVDRHLCPGNRPQVEVPSVPRSGSGSPGPLWPVGLSRLTQRHITGRRTKPPPRSGSHTPWWRSLFSKPKPAASDIAIARRSPLGDDDPQHQQQKENSRYEDNGEKALPSGEIVDFTDDSGKDNDAENGHRHIEQKKDQIQQGKKQRLIDEGSGLGKQFPAKDQQHGQEQNPLGYVGHRSPGNADHRFPECGIPAEQ